MKRLSTFLIATILSGTVGSVSVLANAATPPSPANAQTTATQTNPTQTSSMSPADKQQYNEMLQEASSLMGYVGIANIALMHNMTDEATTNVQKALTLAQKLEGQTTQLNADVMKSGKLKYTSANGKSYDYWLPIENDTFVVNDLDSEYLKSKEPKAAEEDAQIVNTKVVLNTKQVYDSLEKASVALNARNYGDAQVALLEAQQSTFTDEIIGELPLVTARDNLALAQDLMKSNDYSGANFALNHAKDALKDYRSSANKAKTAEAQKLQTDISTVQTELSKKQPSMVADIEKRINSFMNEVKQLM